MDTTSTVFPNSPPNPVAIAVDLEGSPIVVDENGDIFNFSNEQNEFITLAG